MPDPVGGQVMIEFDNVSLRYEGGEEALGGITFELEQGGMSFITGHSGAGKSSLLRLILAMHRPSHGRAVVNGMDLTAIRPSQVPQLRRGIGVVLQDHQLLVEQTVFDNVALPLRVSGYRPRDIGRRVRAALDKVGLLAREQALPRQLSGGEQQRVGIARAVVNKPQLIVADEPTGNLDPHLSAEIMRLFQEFNQVGVSVLVASHDLALVARMQKRVLTLDNGRLVNQGLRQSRGAPA